MPPFDTGTPGSESTHVLRTVALSEPTSTALVVRVNPKEQKLAKKRAHFMALAIELGYVVSPLDKYAKEIGTALTTRLSRRTGDDVYQTLAFSLPSIPRSAVDRLLPPELVTTDTKHTKCWEAPTVPQVRRLLMDLMSASGCDCAGLTRALKTDSEAVIRVVAVPLPTVEIKHVSSQRDRLHINMQYLLADETGELHWPKDENRIEIAASNDLTDALRTMIWDDLLEMSRRGYYLSPGFFRQLGEEDKALEMEAMISNVQAQRQTIAAAKLTLPAGTKPKRQVPRRYAWEARLILEEFPGRKKCFLAEWAGYEPSWERWRVEGLGAPGEPLQTMEPYSNMKGTIALRDWRQWVAYTPPE